MKELPIISQSKMMELILPLLKDQGQVYRKYLKVWAKKAAAGEKITTQTSGGVETTNVAQEGDMIVMNLTKAREKYIVTAKKFEERYQYEKEAQDGFSQYHPLGRVVALKVTRDIPDLLDRNGSFQFMAPWDQPEKVELNDFLVTPPDHSEIYRIARKEFFETYKLDS
jgi:hypothetical protein